MRNAGIQEWVRSSPDHKDFREAVHTILYAISGVLELKTNMVMKGGVLLALSYNSQRYTKDIDFSTKIRLGDFNIEDFQNKLEESLIGAVESLGYGLDCRIQSCKQQPSREDATFPTIQVKVGYAYKSDRKAHARLQKLKSPKTIQIDYSLNEPIGETEIFEIENGNIIHTYSFVELIAEKFRALLQQEVRNRIRRQDIYDLHYLLVNEPHRNNSNTRKQILESLILKASVRDLSVAKESMSNPEIIRRSKSEYDLLANEIEGELPNFDEIYQTVEAFYHSLPWE